MTENPRTTSKKAIRPVADGSDLLAMGVVDVCMGYEMDLMRAVTLPRMTGSFT